MAKGIIIDFNGTLYLDHDLNYAAWKYAFDSQKPKDSKADYDEFQRNIEVLTKDYEYAKAMLDLFNKDSSFDKVKELAELKENKYIDLVRFNKRTSLMEGAPGFLNFLKNNNIPYCIASKAPKMNFLFYLDFLNLKRWFTLDNIVHDDELFKNKNDQFLEAARRMNLKIEDCIIIEDSPKVIMRSLSLKPKGIIYLNSKDKEFKINEILQEIKNFNEIDYRILNK